MATNHEREPQCAISGPHGYAQDLGIVGSAFLLTRTQRRCTTIYEDLPHLSGGEVRQSGKSWFIATLGDSLKEMGAYNHGPGHRPTRVQWLYNYCGLRGQTDKNGTSPPCMKEMTAMEYAKLFVDHVFQLHGLLDMIISDWDPRFTGNFWKSLFDLLSMDLRFSAAFHPQTDGQSERMIQTMENFLRPYVEGRLADWSQHLVLA